MVLLSQDDSQWSEVYFKLIVGQRYINWVIGTTVLIDRWSQIYPLEHEEKKH